MMLFLVFFDFFAFLQFFLWIIKVMKTKETKTVHTRVYMIYQSISPCFNLLYVIKSCSSPMMQDVCACNSCMFPFETCTSHSFSVEDQGIGVTDYM